MHNIVYKNDEMGTPDAHSPIAAKNAKKYDAVETANGTSIVNISTPSLKSINTDSFVMKLAAIASMSGLLFGYDTVRPYDICSVHFLVCFVLVRVL